MHKVRKGTISYHFQYNLRVGSCNLGFVLENNMLLPNPQNMGLLIGRDIMSRMLLMFLDVLFTLTHIQNGKLRRSIRQLNGNGFSFLFAEKTLR